MLLAEIRFPRSCWRLSPSTLLEIIVLDVMGERGPQRTDHGGRRSFSSPSHRRRPCRVHIIRDDDWSAASRMGRRSYKLGHRFACMLTRCVAWPRRWRVALPRRGDLVSSRRERVSARPGIQCASCSRVIGVSLLRQRGASSRRRSCVTKACLAQRRALIAVLVGRRTVSATMASSHATITALQAPASMVHPVLASPAHPLDSDRVYQVA